MWNAIQSISASISPRRLRRWVSNRPTIQPNNALASGSSCYSPDYGFIDVESNPDSKRITMIEPNNALGLYFDTPSPRTFNVESLSPTFLEAQTSRDEADFGEIPLEQIGSDFDLFGQELQTMELSVNYNRPTIDPNNALGLSLDTPQHHILDVQLSNASSWWSTMHNNVLGLSLGTPLSSVGGIELLHPTVPVPLEFLDDDPWTTAWEELPQVGQLTSYLNFFGEDLQATQTRANFSQPTAEPDNSHEPFLQTQPEFGSHMPQDIRGRWGGVRMPNIATRNFIPNSTPWRIEVPSPGPLETNFDPFREELQTPTPSANLNGDTFDPLGEQPSKSEELSVTFGGKFGRQVRWENITPSVHHFIERCAWDTTHSLTVVLEPSSAPYDRWERGWTLKRLFNCLSKKLVTDTNGYPNIALSVFNRISITFPDEAEDVDTKSVIPWPSNKFPGQAIPNADPERIDITPASNLREFLWKGPFQQLSNFLYPADGLTLLSITGCQISVNDAVDLLQQCSSLEEVQLETVQGMKEVEPLTPKPGSKFKFTLIKLSVTSSVDLASMLKLITWAPRLAEFNLTFLDNGSQDTNALSSVRFIPSDVALNLQGSFLQQTMDKIQVQR